ncbi:hypothetical protein ACS0TY_014638 [Phlomoides rotata]
MTPILIFVFLSILSVSVAQEDRAHGLPNEPPTAISPEAYTFFHPDGLQPAASTNPCDSSNCSTLPLAATVQSSKTTATSGLGSGAIAGISVGFLFVCLIGMGVYHVMIRRRSNLRRANPEQQLETA